MRTNLEHECQICGQELVEVFKHHVVPKSKGGRNGEVIDCCYTCNGQVHMMYSEKELSKMSLKELINTSEMKKYISWKQKHPGDYRHRLSRPTKNWKKFHQ
jgi:hypothetical protein